MGPVQLVAFDGGGSSLLECIQEADRAVLWLPSSGVVGRIHGACSGVSIVLPVSLLQVRGDSAYSPDPEVCPTLRIALRSIGLMSWL